MKVKIANKFIDKLIGLMFKKNINYGLLIENCKSIHTFFMLENIDVILLDKNYEILKIDKNVKPNKVIIYKTKKRTNILELPGNSSLNLKINQVIDFNNL